jgi:REP element-mobilizing transposase RayT
VKNRKPTRLPGFDYTTDGLYFVTSCCKNRTHHFGEISDGNMYLNACGNIAEKQIEWLSEQYPYLIIHNYVVMPNHVHILMEINRSCSDNPHSVGAIRESPLRNGEIQKIKTISSLMGAYKTTTSKQIHLIGNADFEWQRSFHDHIVRNQHAFHRIDAYISNNPLKWYVDTLNTDFICENRVGVFSKERNQK